MIIKASKRGGARQLARHLLNGETNEHVNIHSISGFASDRLDEALEEIYAISKGTRCERFMFCASLNPPQDRYVPIEAFEKAVSQIEDKLGLSGQPRAIIFHEKEGRRHAHCVWSRIDANSMTAIDLPFFKNRLKDVSKALYLEHHWPLPQGFIDRNNKNPLNFTRAQWQQAARTRQDPKIIKAVLQEAWGVSDNKNSFQQALKERGYFLAQGTRRAYVALDIYGETYSLSRQLNLKKREIAEKLEPIETLPTLQEAKNALTPQLKKLFTGYLKELKQDHNRQCAPLLATKRAMTHQHREDRKKQKAWQEQRWQQEEARRISKIRKGIKGFWDKLTGKYWKQRKDNERETWQCQMRDQKQREELIAKQLQQRQSLQIQLNVFKQKHVQERQKLIKDLAQLTNLKTLKDKQKTKQPMPQPGIKPKPGQSPGPDPEAES